MPVPAGAARLARWTELALFAAALALNWYLAASFPGLLFSCTSMALFVWTVLLAARITPAGTILLLPIVITRLATLISLFAVEAGAYMPEVNRLGAPGDASASFVVFTAIFFLAFAAFFRPLEHRVLAYARSPLMDDGVALLGWPIIALCAAWGLAAAASGLQSGFPLLQGMDRFLYRREYGSVFVVTLLNSKFLVAALLGTIAFNERSGSLIRTASKLTLLALTILYFLFGDKFFTIISEICFFLMPLLLRRQGQLTRTALVALPLLLALLAATFGATLYIYSDYGRLPTDRTLTLLGERVAGQGELWYVATRDANAAPHVDRHLVSLYTRGLDDADPGQASFINGVETFFFIQHYSPEPLKKNFRKNNGWVQLTMGYEAMALVMFGYVGVAAAMIVAGLLVALSSLYLRRAFESGFPISLFFAVWVYLQIYFTVQQASLWTVAAPGQYKRFLLFFVIEIVLLAVNRGQVQRLALRETMRERRRTALEQRQRGRIIGNQARI